MNTETEKVLNYTEQKSNSSEAKSIFTSKTVWGIVFTTVAAIAPVIGSDVDKLLNKQPINIGQDTAQIVVIICGAAATICGRVEAKDSLYTPNWLPGPNKPENE
ncbi:hypothetical protein [Iningainema tapete]|uniref:Uncharacterized protein n=1 Tax=Iningainema tapete BLCC-T55 TaxID=2748662 RepID=A0A8J7CHQ1_9CYAN|nr:hypothetical protein [Iningainema tapete]MBD2777915.1 hypothetical protein [Iningainema tapete BLCC-T55]